MNTVRLILEDGKLGEEVKVWELKPDTLVSYYEFVKGVSGNRGTIIRDHYKSANGDAKNDGYVSNEGNRYEIRVSGEWKDVQVVVKHLQDALGAKDLNPEPKFLEFPNIRSFKARVLWFFTGYQSANK